MARDFIVDFETMGTMDNSVLLSIGVLACPDDYVTDITELRKNGIHIKFNREQQINLKRQVDAQTIEWWKRQGTSAKAVLSNDNLVRIESAYWTIRSFCFEHGYIVKQSKIWSRGLIDQRWWSSYVKDCQKIDNNITDFLPFNMWRDVRTLLDFLICDANGRQEAIPVNANIIKHNALDDCCLNFLYMQNALFEGPF